MTKSNRIKRALLASALSAGLISTQSASADVTGPGTLNGDLWQSTAEFFLSFSFAAEAINESNNIRPFLIPQARSHGLTTFRDQAISFDFRAKHLDANGNVDNDLNWTISSLPMHGTLTGTPPNMTYTPDANYTGFDRVIFKVDDGADGSTEGTIDIKVQGSYTAFESGQVRPLAMNSDKTRLYALNTPDGKMEVFDVSGELPELLHSVPVGLEPVAIALRNDSEAWVVNTLSDNISVVDLAADIPHVTRTLYTGDEPQDIVFGGPDRNRAFVTTAHRGQHSPSDLDAMTPGTDRADVWVFDAASGDSEPEKVISMFGVAPRALAVTPDGSKVYAAIYKSGNQTTIASHNYRLFGRTSTINGKPGPTTDAGGVEAPNSGVMVKYDGDDWRDQYGTNWNRQIYFDLPDYDVFEIDAMASSPTWTKRHSGVGNALFNMTVNPANGKVYVSNMDARNELKFEGHGDRSDIQTLRGRFIKNQITVIDGNDVTPRDLNNHLADSRPGGSADDNARSLAMPLEMVMNSSGETLYVAAYSSSKVGIFDAAELENGNFTTSEANHIEVSGGGPAGIALDEERNRMYVLTRFNNSVAVVDLEAREEVASVEMYNPEPEFITEGRPFLYDARFSSGRGDSSCGSCHLFGDMDGLAWELGNPDVNWTENPRGYADEFVKMNALRVHHPLKGPMLTQSFRGMEFQGPLHWRGDRTGAYRVNGESLEKAAFKEFRGAFTELLGRDAQPTEDELNKFADFVLQLRYPPNPNRNLDDTLTPKAQAGADVYFNEKTTGFKSKNDIAKQTCNHCHEVEMDIERFGTNTLMSFEGTENPQDFKIPHLRNVYTRVGMFGQKFRDETSTSKHMGDQVTGYGLSHDGAVDTMETFLTVSVFHVDIEDVAPVFEFVTQVPTGLAPIVGQQVTLNAQQQNDQDLIDLMISQALLHTSAQGPNKQQCDLVVHGVIDGEQRGWMMQESGEFLSDDGEYISDADLRATSTEFGNSLTYLCAPPGSGTRVALDRDEDGTLNMEDAVLMGRAPTSVQPMDPFAAPEQDVMVPAEGNGFDREAAQKRKGRFPDFNYFWPFGS